MWSNEVQYKIVNEDTVDFIVSYNENLYHGDYSMLNYPDIIISLSNDGFMTRFYDGIKYKIVGYILKDQEKNNCENRIIKNNIIIREKQIEVLTNIIENDKKLIK